MLGRLLLSLLLSLSPALASTSPKPPPKPPAQPSPKPPVQKKVSTLTPSSPPAVPRIPARRVQITDPQGDAILVVPEVCDLTVCPLLLVSHPYQATPEYGIDFAGHATYARFLERFLEAGYVLLLSNDAGKETWGNLDALEYNVRVWSRAQALYSASGETFTLGFSMGALPATLLGLTGKLSVRATVTVAGVLDPLLIYRRKHAAYPASVARAYSLPNPASPEQLAFALTPHDPIEGTLFFKNLEIPYLAVASRGDTGVRLEDHAERFIFKMQVFNSASRLLEVSGPHLGGPHFSEEVSREAIAFLNRFRSR